MRRWTEYAIEGTGLGLFMLAALAATVLIEHPASPVRTALPEALARRVVMGLLMGLTVALLVYSPWGARSGAHLNPAVTLTFWRLGKVSSADVAGYVGAQFVGAWLGSWVGAMVLGAWASAREVGFVTTVPGAAGLGAAFAAETGISFGLMTVVLQLSSRPRWASYTGLAAGALVAIWIAVEAPLSGMSMNPARTLGPALVSGRATGLWIYFTAPLLGMLGAAELFVRSHGMARVLCAKLYHASGVECPFICAFSENDL